MVIIRKSSFTFTLTILGGKGRGGGGGHQLQLQFGDRFKQFKKLFCWLSVPEAYSCIYFVLKANSCIYYDYASDIWKKQN